MSDQFLETACADAGLTVAFGRTGRYKISEGRYFVRIDASMGTRPVACEYGNDLQRVKRAAMRKALEAEAA